MTRIHSSLAGPIKLQNTRQLFRSNELLGGRPQHYETMNPSHRLQKSLNVTSHSYVAE